MKTTQTKFVIEEMEQYCVTCPQKQICKNYCQPAEEYRKGLYNVYDNGDLCGRLAKGDPEGI